MPATDQVHSALSTLHNEICKRKYIRIIVLSSCALVALFKTFDESFVSIPINNIRQNKKERIIKKNNNYVVINNKQFLLPINHPSEVFLNSLVDVVSVKKSMEHDIHNSKKNAAITTADTKHKNKKTTNHKCELMSPEWQAKPYPTCNSIHEFDLVNSLYHTSNNYIHHHSYNMTRIAGVGGKRIAWMVSYTNQDEQIIFKTST